MKCVDFEALHIEVHGSVMNLNFWMMVERYPNFKEEVGGLNRGCEISSLLDKNMAWACRPSILKKIIIMIINKIKNIEMHVHTSNLNTGARHLAPCIHGKIVGLPF